MVVYVPDYLQAIRYCENMQGIGEGIKDPGIISFCEKKLESLDYLV